MWSLHPCVSLIKAGSCWDPTPLFSLFCLLCPHLRGEGLVRFLLRLSVKTSYPVCLFWASRSATSARQQVLWGPNDCLFQMVIRAAPLCPGLFLIEAQRSRAQPGADQLALPTYLPESCWRHLFDHHSSRHQHYGNITAVLLPGPLAVATNQV